jgi:pyruvate dehydrogenase E2 component (dihydrolipoamide acetyltransferase)
MMAKILEMPKLSPTMEEGVLSVWHKKEGDSIGVDDLLAEVETDKATMEFRSFDKATILKLLVPAGAQVKLGQAVAIIGAAGDDVSALVGKLGGAAPTTPVAAPAPQLPPPAAAVAPAAALASAPEAGPAPAARKGSALDRTEYEGDDDETPAGDGRVFASPFVRKQARELGVDLRGAQGSGPHGRIVSKDLEGLSRALVHVAPDALYAAAAAPRLAAPEARPLSMMRKTIARRLTESKQTVPHFYLTIDVDAEPLASLREKVNAELAALGEGRATKVSLNDFLVKACAIALARVPECNASFSPEAILVHNRVDISVAVAIPDGLVTPVVRNADQKSVAAIAREVRELAARAKQKKLKPEEMQDGTFSISNLGMFGIDSFSAVINPPEGAILAVGQVRDEPVVKAGQVVAGKRLAMTLSCDHRVVDGAVGASFLAELRALIERPMSILSG